MNSPFPRIAALALLASTWLAGVPPVRAEDARPAEPPGKTTPDAKADPDGKDEPNWERDTLTGRWGGLRETLAKRGLTFSFDYVGEALANVRGGERRLAIYEGRFGMTFEADLEKAFGWTGATFHVTGYQIHGRGLSANALGNLLTAGGIEARASSRLFTLWLEQAWEPAKLSLRVGQLAADEEFAVSDTAATFVNSTFGWPAILGTNLIGGGPAYPLAAPGARLKLGPFGGFSLQAAVFSGDPAGTGSEPDPQLRNRSGTRFSFTGGTFAIGEAALQSGESGWIAGLPTTLKAGFWYHSGRFDDQRFDAAGLSLADPATSGAARRRRGNYGGYVIVDQALWRVPGSKERGLNAFLRAGANPSDRNLIGWYVDAGLVMKGAFDARPDDAMGVAFGLARIGSAARALDRDAIALAGSTAPVRDYETVIEFTYVAQITPWLSVQPDLQLILHPGGTVPNSRDPSGATIKDAVVLGVRTTVKF